MDIPYLEYFGLTEKPFGLTPDPHFYFETETHREALSHLEFLLSQKEGFALIYGDVGLGKTTISRIFLSSLDRNVYNTALILNPIMEEAELVKAVSRELGLNTDGLSRKEVFDQLERFLLEEHRKGREMVLAIDEAQLLSKDLLEFIRILSNIETEKEKIIRIVLFAQPELVEKLKKPNMRYLSQRITVTCRLKPFSESEVGSYINYRLVKAGSRGLPSFKKSAVKLIYEASGGYPRLVNILSDRCMLALYGRSKESVDRRTVADVLNEENVSLASVTKRRSSVRVYRVAVFALIIVVFILLGAFAAYLLELK